MKSLIENWNKFLQEGERLAGFEFDPQKKYIFSPKKIDSLKTPDKQPISDKPKGLWYSCGDDWYDWMKGNMPEWLSEIKYVYEISLTDKLLYITSQSEFMKFQAHYSTRYKHKAGYMRGGIDWELVADNGWSGIEICPYVGSMRRMSINDWYYSWDVSSGCVWAKDGISAIKLVHEVKD